MDPNVKVSPNIIPSFSSHDTILFEYSNLNIQAIFSTIQTPLSRNPKQNLAENTLSTKIHPVKQSNISLLPQSMELTWI